MVKGAVQTLPHSQETSPTDYSNVASAQNQKLTPELIKHYLLHDVSKIYPMVVLDTRTHQLYCSAKAAASLEAMAQKLNIRLPYELVGCPDKTWPTAYKVWALRIRKSQG